MSRKRVGLWVAGCLVLLAVWLVIEPGGKPMRPDPSTVDPVGAKHSPTPLVPVVDTTIDIQRALQDVAHDNEVSAEELVVLKNFLFQGNSSAAARDVADFLRTGRDAFTGQRVAVGPGGILLGSSSLRTALLDWLPALDPHIAWEVAKEIIQASDSPDEYALALRNLAWNDVGGDLHAELKTVFYRMLDRADWRENPTAGYLEAMDVAVELGGAETFSRLSAAAAPEFNHPALVHAACMSMDRMVLRDPSLLTSAWKNDPHWLDQAPMQRASLVSRLDILREDHRTILLDYLSSERVKDDELDEFQSLFPNGNYLHGDRLITHQETTPSVKDRVVMDEAIAREIDRLLPHAPPRAVQRLQRIRDRLADWLEGLPHADGGGN